MDAMTLFSVLMVRRALEDSFSSRETKTRAPLLTVRPANLQDKRNASISFKQPKNLHCEAESGTNYGILD